MSKRIQPIALGAILLASGHLVAGDALPASKCDGASRERFGIAAVRPGLPGAKPPVPEPKKVRNVPVKLPSQLPKSCQSPLTIFEVLVAPSGKVEQVWMLRSPCKELEDAGLGAIRQWEYEPLRVEGKAVPFCMTVTSMVHFR